MVVAQQLRALVVTGLRRQVIILFVLAAVWAVLNMVLPDGGWQLVPNIGVLILTFFGAMLIKESLGALGNPGWLAWLIAMFLWGLAVIGLRSVVLSLLGVWD